MGRFHFVVIAILLGIRAGLSPAPAQRLDGPEIVADCQLGPGILRLCKSDCAAANIMERERRVNNEDRLRKLRECQSGCWGIMKALEDCPRR